MKNEQSFFEMEINSAMANDFSEKSETLAKLDNAGIIMVSGIFLIGSLFITIVALPNFI